MMKGLSNLLVPGLIASMAITGILNTETPKTYRMEFGVAQSDTVIYPNAAYKLRRVGSLEEVSLDSLYAGLADTLVTAAEDTIPHLTARDTIKAPDSLRFSDPFRYRYYVALVDSLTHRQVRDSLIKSYRSLLASGDSLLAFSDSLDWKRLDSIYISDSTAIAVAKELAYYNSLDKRGKKKYDFEKALPAKLARMDSLKKAKEDRKERRDSITEATPRVLQTFALPDSMQFKRIIQWTVDQDFHDLYVSIPDTSYNYTFNDYNFLKEDVNATWLGVAGSPAQLYNFFKRPAEKNVEFYKALEPWTFSPSTLKQYNTKTPHTELAYYGTLFANQDIESNSLHILTTQNILPSLNFTLLYERWGGEGILENEQSINKTFATGVNYLGKRYMMNSGYIYNKLKHGENGGIQNLSDVRDTTLNGREIAVFLSDAKSVTKKNTLFLDQQVKIPFSFIKDIFSKKDTTFTLDTLSVAEMETAEMDEDDDIEPEETEVEDEDITTAFIGHSLEYSTYSRKYEDKVTTTAGKEYFDNIFNYDPVSSHDSLGVRKIDNKLFLRLQPWSRDAIVSKLDVGIGDYTNVYNVPIDTTRATESSIYAYAGAHGQLKKYFFWNAKAHYVFLGSDFGDMDISAAGTFNIYPFRRARTSPVSFGAKFSTSLSEPTYYQKHMYSNHYSWDSDFSKASTTRIEGSINIPRWKFDAQFGYSLLANNIYYDSKGIARQNDTPMSVMSAYVHKDFVIAKALHLDNRALFQFSSNKEVLPLPTAALNLRYYFEFVVQKDRETGTSNVMTMQIGANAFYNTKWNAPSWNPVTGVFNNQDQEKYTNGPFFDVFVNIQWKRACVFVKYENAGMGWPMDSFDYFSANRYVVSQKQIKLGIFWPFYVLPQQHKSVGK